MSFFKNLKTNMGIEEEKKQKGTSKETVKEKPEEKEGRKKERKVEKVELKPKKNGSDWLKSEGQLAVDVYETDSEFCIQAPIAGVEPENIEVSVENGMLSVKGERKYIEETKEKNYFYRECYWGAFSRQILLPEDADPNRIKATLKKGVLFVRIPKVTRITKKKINIIPEE